MEGKCFSPRRSCQCDAFPSDVPAGLGCTTANECKRGVDFTSVCKCISAFFFIYLFLMLFLSAYILFCMYVCMYVWLCWVFVSVRGLSPVAASGGLSSSRCAGLSLSRPLSLRSTGSRRAGSATVAHGPSRSAARGILPDQGSNPRPLHWQADPQPLRHQGSPHFGILYRTVDVQSYNTIVCLTNSLVH